MKTRTWMFALLALVVVAPAFAQEETKDIMMPPSRFVAMNNSLFAANLYAQLREADGNLFFSPHSISTALAMTYVGARGNTAVEMAKVMHFNLSPVGLHPAFRQLQDTIVRKPRHLEKGQTPLEMSIANALWPQKDYTFLPEYFKSVNKNYDTQLQNLDYKTDHEAARKIINDWVATKTKDKIKDLIPKGAIVPLTRLVLTNAIYFKAGWMHQFNKRATKDAAFWTSADKSVNVPTMHQTQTFGYSETDTYQLLSMPYVGYKTMTILLPKKRDGLAALEKELTWKNIHLMLRPKQHPKVTVSLPKFKFTSSFQLADTLKAMGMKDAFSDKGAADFSGMTGTRDLYISKVIHKAFVDVNEEGTEAAAATAVVMNRVTSALRPEPPKIFNADHPFLFVIRDNTTGAILFMGRVVKP